VLAVLARIFGFSVGHKSSRPDNIDHLIIQFELLEDKLENIRYNLEKRSDSLFEMIIQSLRKGDNSRASIYATEVSQVRNMLKAVIALENMITMAKERLKTTKDTNELIKILMTFGAALETVRDQVKRLYPAMSVLLDEVSRNVKAMIVETSFDATNINPEVLTESATEILREAWKKAEEKVNQILPEPPIVGKAARSRQEDVIVASPPVGGGGGSRRERRLTPEELEEAIMQYIREHGGFLDVSEFQQRYGVTRREVMEALHRLAEKGMIRIA